MAESLNDRLAEIESAGLIRLAQVEPELEFLFRHALVQDAAYESLLKQHRAALHAQVGAALEALYPDRREELAATLALHFEAAGEDAKAVAYYRMATRHARAMYAYEEAVSYLHRAREISQHDASPDIYLEILEELADLLQIVAGMKWAADYAAFEAAERSGAPSRDALTALVGEFSDIAPHPEVAHALIRLAWDAWLVRDPADRETARRYAEDAVRLAEALADPHLLSDALQIQGGVIYGAGLLREGVELAFRRAALARDPRLTDLRQRALILSDLSNSLLQVGEYEAAIPYAREAGKISALIGDVSTHLSCLAYEGNALLRLDRWDAMLAL